MNRLRLIAGKMRHVAGWKPDMADHRDFRLPPPAIAGVPAARSLRADAPPIRDQQQLGTCVANSSLEACGFLYLHEGKADPILSRLWAYALCRKAEGTPLHEDSGCRIRDMMTTLAQYGAPPETAYPYIEAQFSNEPPQDLYAVAAGHKILYYYRCPNLFTIKASIAQGYPVVFGVTVPANMLGEECASTGHVKYPGPTEDFEGSHAILGVGYDDATQEVCFQNSWSEAWGDKGFGYLPYTMFDDGLVQDAWTIRKEQL